VLYNNVVFSELWSDPPPTKDALEQLIAAHVVSSNSILELAAVQTVWPRYAVDPYVHKWAKTAMPVLTLNGDMDVQTPIELARDYETKLTGESKYFVFVPWANHGVIDQSRTRDGDQCGMRLILDFMSKPTAKPATDCTSRTLPPNVNGNPDMVNAFYGTSSAWIAGAAAPTVARADVEDTLRSIRRHITSRYMAVRAPISPLYARTELLGRTVYPWSISRRNVFDQPLTH
jgi:hypothetical protein